MLRSLKNKHFKVGFFELLFIAYRVYLASWLLGKNAISEFLPQSQSKKAGFGLSAKNQYVAR